MTTQNVEIDGFLVDPKFIPDLTIRWHLGNSGPEPVLYRGGKRVTKAWRVVLEVEQEADKHGGNANTD